MVPEAVLEEAARRFSLLGDPTRLRLLSVLHHRGETPVSAIAELAGVTVANASQHLVRLTDGGIVARRRVGRSVLYRIADRTVESLCDIVCASVAERARVLTPAIER